MTTSLSELVSLLEELALLLEFNDANPFRIRAIQNGARVLDSMHGELSSLIADRSLEHTKGIGKGLLELVTEYVSTGFLREVTELRATIPPGVVSLTSLSGVGAKKAKELYRNLGITSIGELEYACKENRLVELKGFGEKTQNAILKSIATWNAARGKCRLPMARSIADDVADELRGRGATTVEVTGQVRRCCEVIDEVHLVCIGAGDPVGVADELLTRQGVTVRVTHTTAQNHASTMFRTSASQEFLAAFDNLYPAALHDVRSEDEIFAAANLDMVPPELRESASVLELSATHALPALIGSAHMKGMLHVHTRWSDGADTVRDMALKSEELGYAYIAICDHSRTAVYAQGLSVERVKQQHEEIDRVNREFQEEGRRIRVLKGIESDILSDGSLDYDDDILELFDVVVASVHSAFRLDKQTQTQRIIRALRNPYTTVLGHPTGRLLLARDGYDVDMEAVIDAAAETGTIIELNANPYRLDMDWRLHRYAVSRGVRIAINPDSHETGTLRDVEYGLCMARKGMLGPQDVINTLNLHDFLDAVRSLRERKLALARNDA